MFNYNHSPPYTIAVSNRNEMQATYVIKNFIIWSQLIFQPNLPLILSIKTLLALSLAHLCLGEFYPTLIQPLRQKFSSAKITFPCYLSEKPKFIKLIKIMSNTDGFKASGNTLKSDISVLRKCKKNPESFQSYIYYSYYPSNSFSASGVCGNYNFLSSCDQFHMLLYTIGKKTVTGWGWICK